MLDEQDSPTNEEHQTGALWCYDAVMRIYVSHPSSIPDYSAELYTPLTAALAEHELMLPHLASVEPLNSWESIRQADLVIAEVSEPSTGQGIELGWADGAAVPIVAIYRADSKPSSSIKLVAKKLASYQDVEDLKTVVRTLVAAME